MQGNTDMPIGFSMGLKLFGMVVLICFIAGCDDDKTKDVSPSEQGTDADGGTDTDTDSETDTGADIDGGQETDSAEAYCGEGTAKPACECGDTVMGDFTFTSDLVCPTGIGLTIGADGVVVDGAQYLLDGSAPTGCVTNYNIPEYGHVGIYNDGYDDVEIRNLEIVNFCKGIFVTGTPDGINNADNNLIENNHIHHCGDSTTSSNDNGILFMVSVTNTVVRENEIHDIDGFTPNCIGCGNAMYMEGPDANYNTITKNAFYNNRKEGFVMRMKPNHNEISYNESWGNGRCGILLRCKKSDDNIVEYNYVHDNGGDGIFIGGSNNLVRYNRILNNRADFLDDYPTDNMRDGDGIDFGRNDGSRNNEVRENEICGNEGVDIDVVDDTYGNFGDDNVCETTNNYDDDGASGCTSACEAS